MSRNPSIEVKKKRFKKKKQKVFTLLGLLAVLALAISVLHFSESDNQLDNQRERLAQLTLPPDGSKLYSFLLREIPDIVSEIPCACCAMSLDACYRGGCPPT